MPQTPSVCVIGAGVSGLVAAKALLKAIAEKLTTSVEASSEGKDYPAGKVLQPQRGTPWMEMPEYQKLYPTFQKLKPTWSPPSENKKQR